MLTILLTAFLATAAHAEKCPIYDGHKPEMVVDAGEFKFFYFQRGASPQNPSVMLVENSGQVVEALNVSLWRDDMFDYSDFHNKKLEINCTFNYAFLKARYVSSEGQIYTYEHGEVRTNDSGIHRLICD